MVTTRGIARSTGAGESVTDTRARPRTTERTDLVTAILSLWLITGLYVDGWAHLNRPSEETFFTPWHGILYSGFFAVEVWMAWTVFRIHKQGGRSWRESVPVGYGLGLIGIVFSMWYAATHHDGGYNGFFDPAGMVLVGRGPVTDGVIRRADDAGERLVQPPCGTPDGVTFGHRVEDPSGAGRIQPPAEPRRAVCRRRIVRRPSLLELLRWTRWCDVFHQANVSLRGLWPLLLVRRPWVVSHHSWYCRSDGRITWKDRLSFDAPIHSVDDIKGLPFPPRTINIKPTRIGGLRPLLEIYEHCAEHGVAMYGGGMGELGPARMQIQLLASLFHSAANFRRVVDFAIEHQPVPAIGEGLTAAGIGVENG